MGCHDNGFSGAPRGARQLLLAGGHRFQGKLDTQITAGHHDAIGNFQNVFKAQKGGGFFNFGHDTGAAGDERAGLGNVFRTLHE